MSLLLDALKKSGDADSNATGLSGIQLEDIHPSPTRAHRVEPEDMAARPAPRAPLDATPPIASATPQKATASSRAAGENLFAAKKATPAKKRKRLGIVPMAMIGGGIFAVIGGLYVYNEITPPQQRFYHFASTPSPSAPPPPSVVAARPTPITPPLSPTITEAAAKPALVPLAPAEVEKPVANPEKTVVAAVTPVQKSTARKAASRRSGAVKTKHQPLDIQRQQEPDSIDAILSAAYQAYQKGDNATAWQRYREALARDAKNRDALLGLAVLAQQQGQDEAALHYYRQVLMLDPRDPVANAGLSTFGNADAASKESRLKQLLVQHPDSAALHFALANQYVEQARWSEAQQSYFNALAQEPSNALFAFNLAVSLDHLGQRKAAARYYQQAIQFDTTGAAGFNRAQAQQRLNELTAASH